MTLNDILARAHGMLGLGTVYWPGFGGADASAPLASQQVFPGRVWPTLTAAQRARFGPLALDAGIDVSNQHTTARICDCSGYVCWVLGMNRNGAPAAWTTSDGSIYTGSIWHDASHGQVLFENLQGQARVGALLVYRKPPRGNEPFGHIALVTAVNGSRAARVLHCSASNFRQPPHDAIAETDASVFDRHSETLTVWCRDIAP